MAPKFSFPKLTLRQRAHGWHDRILYFLYHVVLRQNYALAKVKFFAYAGDDGPLLDESDTYYNLVVTVGKDLMLDRLFGLSGPPAVVGNIGVGTDNAAATAAQNKLNPVTAGTVLIQTNDAGTARAAETVTAQSTFGTGVANFVWAETGQFNGNVNGTSIMFDRIAPIGPFTKTSAVSIVVQIQTTQS